MSRKKSVKATRREQFLSQMEKVVPWSSLLEAIEPYYPKAGRRGGQPRPLESMLRIHLLQQWYNLSDPGMEEALHDIPLLLQFTGLERSERPDETTILNFRHLLETHELGKLLFERINRYLQDQGVGVSKGTMVDATIISAAGSTKNQAKQRDPEMHSTKKNNNYYFGARIHIGVDVNSGAVHSVTLTAANGSERDQMAQLVRPGDEVIFADAGYSSDERKRAARAEGIRWEVNDKARPKHTQHKRIRLSSSQKKRNRRRARIRARVEHPFRVIKCQFHHTKLRYKGLAKNLSQAFVLFGLANLYSLRGRLQGAVPIQV